MPQWDPALYLRFERERTQPAIDLVRRIALKAPCNAIDVGCGPGNSTQVIKERWPLAQITGLDKSQEMIESARQQFPQGSWVCQDVRALEFDQKFDLVFSNAALQWVPDHAELFPGLLTHVADSGALAVQLPANQNSALHRAVYQIADDPQWAHHLQSARGLLEYHPPAFYYDLLSSRVQRLDLWITHYVHVLEGHADLLTWYRGTGLRPFLAALPDAARQARFEDQLMEKIRPAYRPQRDGRILFPFERLFLIAYR